MKLCRAIGRMLHIDDNQRIQTYRSFLTNGTAPSVDDLKESDRRLLRMLIASLLDQAIDKTATLEEGIEFLWNHPQVRAELLELLGVLQGRIDHVHVPLPTHSNAPIQIHSRYTRLEVFAAFGVGGELAKVAPWQDGVRWVPDEQADLFAFTLDKSTGSFSPTTRYRDCAISRDLIHWESQNATRADRSTGLRYQNHEAQGSTVIMFARLKTDDRAFWCLGPATYVSHKSERPMQVKWRLNYRLPGDLYAMFDSAVA